MNITETPHDTIAVSNLSSSRPAYRNEADAKMRLSLDIEHAEVAKEDAASCKVGDGRSFQGIPFKMPDATHGTNRNGGYTEKKPTSQSSARWTSGQDAISAVATRNTALTPPAAPPFPEGKDPRERQTPGPPAEQVVWHEGETLGPRTFSSMEDHEVL